MTAAPWQQIMEGSSNAVGYMLCSIELCHATLNIVMPAVHIAKFVQGQATACNITQQCTLLCNSPQDHVLVDRAMQQCTTSSQAAHDHATVYA